MKYMMLVLGVAVLSGCGGGGGGDGVCTGYRSSINRTYCYSNFSSSECSDYNSQDVNGASPWYFYSGQTCSDRGLNEGSN